MNSLKPDAPAKKVFAFKSYERFNDPEEAVIFPSPIAFRPTNIAYLYAKLLKQDFFYPYHL